VLLEVVEAVFSCRFGVVSTSSSNRGDIALPTVVSEQVADAHGEELADAAIPAFDLFQGRVEIVLDFDGRICVTQPSEENQG